MLEEFGVNSTREAPTWKMPVKPTYRLRGVTSGHLEWPSGLLPCALLAGTLSKGAIILKEEAARDSWLPWQRRLYALCGDTVYNIYV